MLTAKNTPGANLVIRGARVLDPTEGTDATVDVRIDKGVIAAIGTGLDTNEHQVRFGLVVRMAVLYDVLTGGPVGVRALAAAEVA